MSMMFGQISQNISANCRIIWGKADYNVEVSGNPGRGYTGQVMKANEISPLTLTSSCKSTEEAWMELDRLLNTWARQRESGEPMSVVTQPTLAHRIDNSKSEGSSSKEEMDISDFSAGMDKMGLDGTVSKKIWRK